jgi:error-prone DNA polymerase
MRDDIRSTHALRLGLREIKGISEEEAKLIMTHRRHPEVQGRELTEPRRTVALSSFEAGLRSAPQDDGVYGYDSIRDLWLRTKLDPGTLTRLAEADAFGSLGLSRREALWACKALRRAGDKDDLPLFALAAPSTAAREPDVALPPMPLGQEVIEDYRMLRLSLRQHPLEFIRDELDHLGVIKNETLHTLRTGFRVTVAGLVLIRQRPGSANGVIFLTLEDESAVANIIVWPAKFERYRPEVLGGRLLLAKGPVQNESNVVHVVAEEIIDATALLSRLGEGPAPETLSRADHVKHGDEREDIRARGARRRYLTHQIVERMDHAPDLVQAAPGSAHKPARRGKLRAAHPPQLDLADSSKRAPWPKGRNFR